MTPHEQQRLIGMVAGAFGARTIEDLAERVKATTGIVFANPRHPTGVEIERALGRLEGDREALALMQDRGNPRGQVLGNVRRLLYGRLHEPATDAGGQPLALDIPPPTAKEGQRDEFAWLTPEEAGDRLRWAERHANYGDHAFNKDNEAYGDTTADIAELKSIRDSAPTAEPVPQHQHTPEQHSGPPIGATLAMREAQRARLHADPRYLNRRHPEHAAAMEEMAELYKTDYGDPVPLAVSATGESVTSLPNVLHGRGPLAPTLKGESATPAVDAQAATKP
jgi:hypothetical protein